MCFPWNVFEEKKKNATVLVVHYCCLLSQGGESKRARLCESLFCSVFCRLFEEFAKASKCG